MMFIPDPGSGFITISDPDPGSTTLAKSKLNRKTRNIFASLSTFSVSYFYLELFVNTK
jgi:hypothetical protein